MGLLVALLDLYVAGAFCGLDDVRVFSAALPCD